MIMQVGTIHDKNTLLVRVHVGEAKHEEQTFELSVSPAYSPIIEHPDGRKYSLSWQEILNLAIDAFSDDEEERSMTNATG